MFTTFDRYLFSRFAFAFVALFVASVGLFAVVDGFMNLDAFQQAARKDTVSRKDPAQGDRKEAAAQGRASEPPPTAILFRMARHYVLQSSSLLDLLGPTAAVLAVLTTMALLVKHGELHPLLAAGIPTYRLATPFVLGVLAVNGLMAVNQELIMPQIASELQGAHGADSGGAQPVEAQYDPLTYIYLTAESLQPAERTLRNPEFLLQTPAHAMDSTKLSAESAKFYPARGDQPAGWLLKAPQPAYRSLRLTEEGRRLILPQRKTDDVFIVSSLSADQLAHRGGGYRFLTTPELLRRIRLPAGSLSSFRAHVMHLHSRLTRPILCLIGVFLVLPLIARRERMSQVQNIAACMAALSLVYGLTIGGGLLGQAAVMRPELAVWGPLTFGAAFSAWLSGGVRT
ncbi:MAG: LptF/LptG family permease [Planctomyces sp.]|nr:LptF/LptG family permease [Planctomyces sp.]